MKKIVMICALALTAAIAASSLAVAGGKPVSAKDAAAVQCAAEKKADRAAFNSLYGEKAMHACIKGETPGSAAELKNAAKQCKAAKADDPTGFAEAWGTGKDAYGKCVSTTVKAGDEADTEEFKNAAKECKAARSADAGAFAAAWGDKKNALGKCVSATVKVNNTGV